MSLLVSNGKIFVGTCSGILLVFNSLTHDVIHCYHGYRNEIKGILSMSTSGNSSHIKRFSRILSKKDSIKFDSSSSLFPELTTSGGEYTGADRNLILTLGRGYRGVVGNYPNHPPIFLFPSSSSSSSSPCSCSCSSTCSCETDSLRSKVPRPNSNEGFLLFWSCEDQPTFNNDGLDSCSTLIERSTETSSSSAD